MKQNKDIILNNPRPLFQKKIIPKMYPIAKIVVIAVDNIVIIIEPL